MTDPRRFSYHSTDDVELVGYRWLPSDEKRAAGVVVLAHGMGEHIRRYDHVAESFAEHGFAVYGHDHRGHGSSISADRPPGHLGSAGWQALVDDLNLLIALAKSEHPDRPVAIVAHSMGSFATQQFLLDHAGDVDAVALTGTAALDLLEPALDLSGDVDLSAFNTPSSRRARTTTGFLATTRSSMHTSQIPCAGSVSTPNRRGRCSPVPAEPPTATS